MDEIERQIAALPLPPVRPSLDARIESLFTATDRGSPKVAILATTKPTLLRLAVAAVILVVVASVLLWRIDARHGVAFAQMQQAVRDVTTVQYTLRSFGPPLPPGAMDTRFPPNVNPHDHVQREIERLTSRLKSDALSDADRRDLNIRLALLKPLLSDYSTVYFIERIKIAGKDRQRTEQFFPPFDGATIRNGRTGMTVSIDHANKKFAILSKQVVFDRTAGTREEQDLQTPATLDFFRGILEVPPDATEKLKPRTIDGQDAVGFRSVEANEQGSWTRTYWINPVTKLPVQIETKFQRNDARTSTWIADNFIFNERLSDDLFSTEPPDGYVVREESIQGFK